MVCGLHRGHGHWGWRAVAGAAVLGTDEPEGLGRENRERRRPVADQMTFKQSKELKCLNLGKPA